MIGPTPHPDGVLLQPAPARGRLPRIEQDGVKSIELRHPSGCPAGYAAEPLEKIEQHPLDTENHGSRSGQFKQDLSARDHAALGNAHGNLDPPVDLLKESLGDGRPAEASRLARYAAGDNSQPAPTGRAGRSFEAITEERIGGEVSRGKIFEKGALDQGGGLPGFLPGPAALRLVLGV